jgi:hypothetical protein
MPRTHHLARRARQIKGFARARTRLSPCQRKERIDHPLLFDARGKDALVGGAQGVHTRVRIGQGNLGHGPLPGERRSQLVRGVRDEPALGRERSLQACEKFVEGIAELLELVVGADHREPFMQARGRDQARGRRDRSKGPQDPAGDEPAEPHRDDRHGAERDPRLDQKLMQLSVALCHRLRLEEASLSIGLLLREFRWPRGLSDDLGGLRTSRRWRGGGRHRGSAHRHHRAP